MIKLTPHFNLHEFVQPGKSGIWRGQHVYDKARYIAEAILEPVREELKHWQLVTAGGLNIPVGQGLPISINSGKRSKAYNKKKGGARTSEHLWNRDSAAVDITIGRNSNKVLFQELLDVKHNLGQLIAYVDRSNLIRFIHLSIASPRFPEPQVLLATYERENGKCRYAPWDGEIVRP